MKKLLLITFIITLIAGCGTTGAKKYSGGELHFNSNDWFKERSKKYRANPLNVDVQVKPITTKRYMVNMKMKGDPVHPLKGINPTVLSIFSFCFFNYVSNSNGYSAWIFGLKKDDLSSIKRNQLLILGSKDELEKIKRDPDYKWSKPTQNSQIKDNCSKLIKEEYTLRQ